MTDDQIKYMAERFLQWKLPPDFHPDCGITFKAEYGENGPYPGKHKPVGTNLLTYTQALAMIRYMLDGLPDAAS